MRWVGFMSLFSKQEILAKIPQVEQLLQEDKLQTLQRRLPRQVVVDGVRSTLQRLRKQILSSEEAWFPEDYLQRGQIVQRVIDELEQMLRPSLHRVINATGVVVHTNLGRSPLAREAGEQIGDIASSYSNLEIDEGSGSRGHRYSHVQELLCKLTGAEDAIVVNNNAAAVLLMLAGAAQGKDVIVSRGEQVEVGGSFRIPEVMRQSGCRLVEVGATNKTYLRDYAEAIGPETGALLKVHTSNYRVVGFTAEVPREELVALAHRHQLPALEDLGSGSLVDLSRYGLSYEPTIPAVIEAGMDIVSCSGDKLLGGPQAGIILGKRAYVEKLRFHPLNRALRIDKLTLAALEATLKLYLDEEQAMQRVPVLRMLSLPLDIIEKRAQDMRIGLVMQLGERARVTVENAFSTVGGGALPLEQIDSKVVAIQPRDISVDRLDQLLRSYRVPVFSRIAKEALLLDLRTVADEELKLLSEAVVWAINAETEARL